jgi:hypothetical protein
LEKAAQNKDREVREAARAAVGRLRAKAKTNCEPRSER